MKKQQTIDLETLFNALRSATESRNGTYAIGEHVTVLHRGKSPFGILVYRDDDMIAILDNEDAAIAILDNEDAVDHTEECAATLLDRYERLQWRFVVRKGHGYDWVFDYLGDGDLDDALILFTIAQLERWR